MKVVVISCSPRDESQTVRAAFFIQQILEKQEGINASVLDLRKWDTGFLNTVWRTKEDVPEGFRELWDMLQAAEAYILVSPEYNGMFSPKLSAVLDLFPNSLFRRKAFGIITASTGGIGGMRAAMHMQQYILGLYANPCPQMFLIGNVDKRITAEGNCEDEFILKQGSFFISEFLWLARKLA